MSSRLICFILIGTLLFQMGCAKTVSTLRPEPYQDLDPDFQLPLKAEVTLRDGKAFFRELYPNHVTIWGTDKISGELVAWKDKVISHSCESKGFRLTNKGFFGIFRSCCHFQKIHKQGAEDVLKESQSLQ